MAKKKEQLHSLTEGKTPTEQRDVVLRVCEGLPDDVLADLAAGVLTLAGVNARNCELFLDGLRRQDKQTFHSIVEDYFGVNETDSDLDDEECEEDDEFEE